MTGNFFFFSWLDTDIEGVTDNLTPDLYSVSYDAVADTYTEPQNVTAFTQAMWHLIMLVSRNMFLANILTMKLKFR